MVTAPLVIEIRAGAVASLGPVLADGRISTAGHIAAVVGQGQGEQIAERVEQACPQARVFTVRDGTLATAEDLAGRLRTRSYDAVVGIGGGRTIDVTKYAAARLGIPMVSVATNLAHDGIASPVAILDHDGGRGSYGVPSPIAVIVDIDYVRRAPQRMVRAGIGEVLSNLSAIADWELAAETLGEPVDGLAVTLARTAAESVLHRTDDASSDGFILALAEALVLSGMAMAVAGTSRPCSGGCHEVSHAIDKLFPGTALHGEQVGLGALFAFTLREDLSRAQELHDCLRRHGLPRLPRHLGLTDEQFAQTVEAAPSTRPGRYTILEHLALTPAQVRRAVDSFTGSFPG